jgi:hypothetical protein
MPDNGAGEEDPANLSKEKITIPAQSSNKPAAITMEDIPSPRFLELSGSRLVKERARTLMASLFAIVFLLTLAGSFAGSLMSRWGDVRDWLQVVLPAETGLFGSVLGFYFGSHERSD